MMAFWNSEGCSRTVTQSLRVDFELLQPPPIGHSSVFTLREGHDGVESHRPCYFTAAETDSTISSISGK